MPWLKLLHVTAVIVWCGTLLYLPFALSVPRAAGSAVALEAQQLRVLRRVFTLVTTAAALVAIASGTAVFVLQGPFAAWLVAKLATVSLLVLGHGVCGMLILRAERATGPVRGWSWAVVATSLMSVATIAWLVLQKPF